MGPITCHLQEHFQNLESTMVGVTIGTVRIQGGASAGVCFRGVPNFGGDRAPFLVLATLLRAHRSENVSRLR